jgi:Uma2 family endonuclease
MPPAAARARPSVGPSSGPTDLSERRGVMRGVAWELYDRLTNAINDRPSIKVAFDGKDMEIMVTGGKHESLGRLTGLFVDMVCEGLDRDFHDLGSMTVKRAEVERGIEADLSCCFDPEKITRCREAVAKDRNDPDAFPIPDLAIEIDISPPEADRFEIYSMLRVLEVWRFRENAMSISQLDAHGNFVAADTSQFLHARADEITRWLLEANTGNRTLWMRRVREWARGELRSRSGT